MSPKPLLWLTLKDLKPSLGQMVEEEDLGLVRGDVDMLVQVQHEQLSIAPPQGSPQGQ